MPFPPFIVMERGTTLSEVFHLHRSYRFVTYRFVSLTSQLQIRLFCLLSDWHKRIWVALMVLCVECTCGGLSMQKVKNVLMQVSASCVVLR